MARMRLVPSLGRRPRLRDPVLPAPSRPDPPVGSRPRGPARAGCRQRSVGRVRQAWLQWRRTHPRRPKDHALSDLAPRQNVKFDRNGTTISGYLQLPPGGQRARPRRDPGVVGPGRPHGRPWSTSYAAEGFVALAPDLYGGRVTHGADEAAELAGSLPSPRPRAALAGAVDYLLEQEAVTSEKVGVVGYCMGGGFVLLLATERPDSIGAVVPYYGVGHLPGSYAADQRPGPGPLRRAGRDVPRRPGPRPGAADPRRGGRGGRVLLLPGRPRLRQRRRPPGHLRRRQRRPGPAAHPGVPAPPPRRPTAGRSPRWWPARRTGRPGAGRTTRLLLDRTATFAEPLVTCEVPA